MELFSEYKEDHIELNLRQFQEMNKKLEDYGQMLRESAKENINQSISICDENARELAKVQRIFWSTSFTH